MSGLVFAIFGPTASGKTAVAEALAERIPAELVSADAMQAYEGLPILTNQAVDAASHGQMRPPIHLVGIWPLERDASVGDYVPLAHAAIDGILGRGRAPIVVGGTGLYLRAALVELELPPPPAPGVRERYHDVYDREGPEAAHARLSELDPAAAAVVHRNDRRRVVRALELAEAGETLARTASRLWVGEARHPTLVVGLDVPKEELDRRIESRTRAMFEAGVDDEVRRALERPISATASKILGLDEVATLPREDAIAAIVARTRRYAAYQRKWMRRISDLATVAADRPPGDVADDILALGRQREHLSPRRER
jgi:tRNA dimethylallyltransferase